MSKDPAAPGFTQRAKHEFKEFLIIAGYLAFFFCALVTYTALVKKDDSSTLNYTFAIINALVIGKVILLGELMHLGRNFEARPMYQSVILKSLIFGIFVLVFHLFEEFVKRIIHGQPFGTVYHNIHLDEAITRSIVIFCAFLPLFAFRELRRVLGEDKLYSLFFEPQTKSGPGISTRS